MVLRNQGARRDTNSNHGFPASVTGTGDEILLIENKVT